MGVSSHADLHVRRVNSWSFQFAWRGRPHATSWLVPETLIHGVGPTLHASLPGPLAVLRRISRDHLIPHQKLPCFTWESIGFYSRRHLISIKETLYSTRRNTIFYSGKLPYFTKGNTILHSRKHHTSHKEQPHSTWCWRTTLFHMGNDHIPMEKK